MTRKQALVFARIAGYHNDSRAFTRLRIEARVALPHLLDQWHNGQRQKAAGVKCGCYECAHANDLHPGEPKTPMKKETPQSPRDPFRNSTE